MVVIRIKAESKFVRLLVGLIRKFFCSLCVSLSVSLCVSLSLSLCLSLFKSLAARQNI